MDGDRGKRDEFTTVGGKKSSSEKMNRALDVRAVNVASSLERRTRELLYFLPITVRKNRTVYGVVPGSYRTDLHEFTR